MYFKVIEKLQELLDKSQENLGSYLRHKRSFTNSKKLNLSTVITLLVSQLSRSLQIELLFYSWQQGDISNCSSKSALVQARQKIHWQLFKKLNELILDVLIKEGLYKTHPYGSFKRVAIDGFKIRLPQLKSLSNSFGTIRNQHKRGIIMANAAIAFDVDNQYIIQADLNHVDTSEKGIVTPWIKQGVFDSSHLLIYDRFYAGYGFIYEHMEKNVNFIMRLRKNWNNDTKSFIESGLSCQIVTITIPPSTLTKMRKKGYTLTGKHSMKLRFCKGEDCQGKQIYYVTNVIDSQELSNAEIHESYTRRWDAETTIDVLKNKLQLECFSGHSELVIRQDFHVAICIYNLSKIIHNCAREKLNKNFKKDRSNLELQQSCNVQPNHNLIIGIMGFLLNPILNKKSKFDHKEWNQIIEIICRFPEPIRKGRSFKRKYIRKPRTGKHYYLINFKRAA